MHRGLIPKAVSSKLFLDMVRSSRTDNMADNNNKSKSGDEHFKSMHFMNLTFRMLHSGQHEVHAFAI